MCRGCASSPIPTWTDRGRTRSCCTSTAAYRSGPRSTRNGYVRFAARHVQTIKIDFTATKPLQDARRSPVGVTEVAVLGADELRKAIDPDRRVPTYCGNGPAVRIDGVRARTQVTATMRDLLQRRPVPFSLCGATSVALRSGSHRVEVLAGGGFVPIETTLVKAGFGDVSVTPVQGVDVWRPNPAELTVEVPDADQQSVLAVAQNYNEGWEAYDSTGQKLTPIRIGGWQQGWVLPARTQQVVTASFMPARGYRAGLLLGLVALLAVLAVAQCSSRNAGPAARSGGNSRPPARPRRPVSPAAVLRTGRASLPSTTNPYTSHAVRQSRTDLRRATAQHADCRRGGRQDREHHTGGDTV